MDNIVIVIVNWNTGNLLAKCLKSLYALPEKDMISRIVVVDNDSHDNSLLQAKEIPNQDIPTQYIEPKKNLGFAGANNLAITDIISDTHFSDHILLLNPDTEVKPHAISAMKKVLDHNPKAGIVGPKLLNSDGTLQPSVRAFPSFPILLLLMMKLSRLIHSLPMWKHYMQSDFNYEEQQSVDQVMGAAFLIRKEVAKSVGGLDENFWIWFEEVDYCKQTKDRGWEIIYTPKGEVVHYGGVSFSQVIGPKRVKPFLNSILYYTKKHFNTGAWILLSILWPIALALSIPTALVHMQIKKMNEQRLHAE